MQLAGDPGRRGSQGSSRILAVGRGCAHLLVTTVRECVWQQIVGMQVEKRNSKSKTKLQWRHVPGADPARCCGPSHCGAGARYCQGCFVEPHCKSFGWATGHSTPHSFYKSSPQERLKLDRHIRLGTTLGIHVCDQQERALPDAVVWFGDYEFGTRRGLQQIELAHPSVVLNVQAHCMGYSAIALVAEADGFISTTLTNGVNSLVLHSGICTHVMFVLTRNDDFFFNVR